MSDQRHFELNRNTIVQYLTFFMIIYVLDDVRKQAFLNYIMRSIEEKKTDAYVTIIGIMFFYFTQF